MCKAIENTTKKNQRVVLAAAESAYNNRRWTYDDIFSAYGRPSADKVRAWDYCKELCAKMGGYDLLISSRNAFRFSACFKFEDDGRLCYAYITPDYNRFCYAS